MRAPNQLRDARSHPVALDVAEPGLVIESITVWHAQHYGHGVHRHDVDRDRER